MLTKERQHRFDDFRRHSGGGVVVQVTKSLGLVHIAGCSVADSGQFAIAM
jgi:hypothetical protein